MWTITGCIRGEGSEVTVTYRTAAEARDARVLDQLGGDPELVAFISYDAAVGRLVAGTPTSEMVNVTLGDGATMFLAAVRYFEPAFYRVDGGSGVPVAFVPPGAEA